MLFTCVLALSAASQEHDDILGDAYEYLMRHFASQSGKARKKSLTPERRREIARKAARARWRKAKKK